MSEARRGYRMVARAASVERTRQRILAAAGEAVLRQAYDDIRIADIASAAGVSAQTLHHHFGSKEALFMAAVRDIGEEAIALRGNPPPGDVAAVVAGLVRQYERLGDANWRIVGLENRVPVVAEALAYARTVHRAWLEEVFAPLLPADRRSRRHVLDGLYAATDVGTWKLLRRDLRKSTVRTTEVMESLARGVLTDRGRGLGKD